MTMQQAAKTALDVQDACNLSGVLRVFDEIVMEVIWTEAHKTGKGTDWVNQHPIVTLFLDKLNSLNRIQCFCDPDSRVMHAYDAVETLANPPAAEVAA